MDQFTQSWHGLLFVAYCTYLFLLLNNKWKISQFNIWEFKNLKRNFLNVNKALDKPPLSCTYFWRRLGRIGIDDSLVRRPRPPPGRRAPLKYFRRGHWLHLLSPALHFTTWCCWGQLRPSPASARPRACRGEAGWSPSLEVGQRAHHHLLLNGLPRLLLQTLSPWHELIKMLQLLIVPAYYSPPIYSILYLSLSHILYSSGKLCRFYI